MIVRKYGIRLHRLVHDDIELIRQARNHDDIRQKMFDQRIISKKEQEAWFQTINNDRNYYFLVIYNGKKVGLASGKNMDWIKRENEGGLFIWDESLHDTDIPTKASILLMQLSFELCGVQRTFARINPNNPRARRYSLIMGYTSTNDPNLLVLTLESYQKHIKKLRWFASNGKDTTPLNMDNIEFPDMPRYKHLYRNLPDDVLQLIRTKTTI